MRLLTLLMFLLMHFISSNDIYNQTTDEPVLTISCIGGRIVGGKCNCPSGTRFYNGRCAFSIIPPCHGGWVKSMHCICPSRTRYVNGFCKAYL